MPRGTRPVPRRRVVRHFSVLDRLDPRDRPALDKMVGAKKFDWRRAQLWCAHRGCVASKWALYRYRWHVLDRAKAVRQADKQVEREAESLVLYAKLARNADPPDYVGAAVEMCELLCFTTLRHITPDDLRRDLRLLFEYTAVVTAMTKARQRFLSRDTASDRAAAGAAGASRPAPAVSPTTHPKGPKSVDRRRLKPMSLDTLPADIRTAYEREVLSVPGTTARSAIAWLAARGVHVSKSAVIRHRARHAQDSPRRLHAQAVARRVRELLAEEGLTEADLAAGHRLRAAEAHFLRLRNAHHAAYHGVRMPAREMIALINAVRVMLG